MLCEITQGLIHSYRTLFGVSLAQTFPIASDDVSSTMSTLGIISARLVDD